MSDEVKWMRRTGRGNLHAQVDDATCIELDWKRGKIEMTVTGESGVERVVMSPDRFRQWLAAASFYVAGQPITVLIKTAPDLPAEESDDIPF